MNKIISICIIVSFCGGCCVVSENRVFPKLDWYWSKDCKMQRDYNKEYNRNVKEFNRTNNMYK